VLQGGWQTWECDAWPKKNLQESSRMGRRIVMMKLICLFLYSECKLHIAYKVNRVSLPTDYTLGECCSQMQSKVSSGWLPSYIQAKWPVLETLKMDTYFPDSLYVIDMGTPKYARVEYLQTICVHECSISLNVLLHTPKRYGHSPVGISWCTFRLRVLRNVLLHTSQGYGY